jgi:hypothetical protein
MNVLDQFTDKQLEEELQRRRNVRFEEFKKRVAACKHEWKFWSDYYGKGRDCLKCGAKE